MRTAAIPVYFAVLGNVFVSGAAWAQPTPSGATATNVEEVPVGSEAAQAAARPYARWGAALYAAGLYVEALDRFLKADALYPTPQYRVYAARIYAKLGKLVKARRMYERAIALPLPPNAPASFGDTQLTAVAEIQEIRRRLATVQVVVFGPAADAVSVTIDGAAVDSGDLAKKEIEPGKHTIIASAKGFDSLGRVIEIREGSVERVEMTLQKASPPPRRGAVFAAPALPSLRGEPPQPDPQRDASTIHHEEPEVTLSHRGQVGAFARADIDPINGGVVFAPGVSYGLVDRLEVAVAALIGKDKGFEPEVTFLVLTDAWKPFVNVGAPVFFMDDGAYVGVRGAAGLQWDPIRHLGFFVQVGGTYFGSVPKGYANGLFTPSAGVQARL